MLKTPRKSKVYQLGLTMGMLFRHDALDPKTWLDIEATFAGANLEANWKAMFKTADVFRHLASEVGAHLGYTYPDELDQNVTAHLTSVKKLAENEIDASYFSQKNMANEVVEWARKDENIRVVILTSTRANPNASVDALSDYDIELAVRNREQFSNPDEWMSTFGQIMVRHSKWTMVHYLDAPRIDFSLMTVEELEEEVNAPELAESWDIGYKVLLDKDGMTKDLKPPTYTAFRTKPPTESEYDELVHHFWWSITYVAKYLYRDELFFAKYMLDNALHHKYLKTSLDWYVGMNNNWEINTGVAGKWLKKYLDPEIWSDIEMTFVGANLEENWKAMFKIAEIFGRLTSEIGTNLGYTYPTELDQNVTVYLNKIGNSEE